MATGKKEEQREVSGNRGMEVQLVLCGFPTKLECGVSPLIKTLAILPRPPTHQPHPPARQSTSPTHQLRPPACQSHPPATPTSPPVNQPPSHTCWVAA